MTFSHFVQDMLIWKSKEINVMNKRNENENLTVQAKY